MTELLSLLLLLCAVIVKPSPFGSSSISFHAAVKISVIVFNSSFIRTCTTVCRIRIVCDVYSTVDLKG